MKKYTNMKSGG